LLLKLSVERHNQRADIFWLLIHRGIDFLQAGAELPSLDRVVSHAPKHSPYRSVAWDNLKVGIWRIAAGHTSHKGSIIAKALVIRKDGCPFALRW
jgi:hypothetical protein